MLEIKRIDGAARRGTVTTVHGTFDTPAFMPVGTSGAVKALTGEDLEQCGAQIILGNTYHLYLRPGHELVREMGGLAAFAAWNKPTLTDSGGYQVFSLRHLAQVTDEGVSFQSHHDGSRHLFTPERVMDIQVALGADIVMTFDQCVPYPSTREETEIALHRTFDWTVRAKGRFEELAEFTQSSQKLFGIVQGGVFADLRKESCAQLVPLDLPGYAIGGLSVGEPKTDMEAMLAVTVELLPKEKPRYLMGVGYPEDILMSVSYGVDMFDCVLPTRNARTGSVFTSHGPLVYRNAEYAKDERPLDPECDCKVCKRYGRAYLRHLYNQSEITAMVLSSYHSTYFFQSLMRKIRAAISAGKFSDFRKSFLEKYTSGSNAQTVT